jgi:hypothetical protein
MSHEQMTIPSSHGDFEGQILKYTQTSSCLTKGGGMNDGLASSTGRSEENDNEENRKLRSIFPRHSTGARNYTL